MSRAFGSEDERRGKMLEETVIEYFFLRQCAEITFPLVAATIANASRG